MPSSQQAAKRMRQTEKRRTANRARKSKIRTFGRHIEEALAKGDFTTANTVFQKFQQRVDKAAKTHTIHRNAAARKKSRMAKKIQDAQNKKG